MGAALGLAVGAFNRGSENLKPLRSAIGRGSVRIAFAGHSILENNNQNSRFAGVPYIFERRFRERFPEIDKPEFVNVSLGGRDAYHLASPTYVGRTDDNSPNTGYFRAPQSTLLNNAVWKTEDLTLNGSTVGKAWLDVVRDLAPDAVMLQFDLNEDPGKNPCTSPTGLYPSMTTIIEAMMGWAKRPTIILGTSHTGLPDQAGQPDAVSGRTLMQQCARINRALARKYKLPLIDGQRNYELLTRGVDVTRPEPHVEAGLRYDGVLGGTSAFTLNSTYWSGPYASDTTTASSPTGATFRNSTGGTWHYFRKRTTADVHVQVAWTMTSSNPLAEVYYRVAEGTTSVTDDKYLVRLNAANLELASYDPLTNGSSNTLRVIASVPLDTPVASGAVYYLDVVAEGARHRIRVNGKLMIDVYDFTHMRSGWIGIGQARANQNAQIKVGTNFQDSFFMEFFDPQVVNTSPPYTDAQLLGTVNDWATNPDSVGGNTTVHLTTAGYPLVYDELAQAELARIRAAMGL